MIGGSPGGKSNEMAHFPEYRSGCYTGRPTDACWFCLLRTIAGQTTSRGTDTATTADSDPIGRRVMVPGPCHDGRSDEYVEGEVIDVHPSDASDPKLAVVDLNDDRIALPMAEVRFVD